MHLKSEKESMRFFADRNANLLFLVTALFWFAQYAYAPYVNPSLSKMGASAVLMGAVSGAYGLTQMILRIPLGLWADKIGKKRCVCAGCLFCAAASFCMFFINNPIAFLFSRALAGVAASAWVAFTILYSTYFPPEQSSSSITMLNVSNNIGVILAFILTGLIVSKLGARASFAAAGIVGVIALVISFFAAEQPGSQKMVSLSDFKETIKDSNLLLSSIYAVIAQIIAFATFQTFTNNYAVSIGLRMDQLSYMNFFVLAPTVICGYFTSKYLLRLFDTKILIISGFILMSVYCFVMPLTVNTWQIYTAGIIAGVGYSLTYSLFLGICVKDISVEKRTAAMGFFQAVYGIGITLGPVIMGWLVDRSGLKMGFVTMAAISLVTAFSIPFAYKNFRKTH